MDNSTSFGSQAAHYASVRPTYPDELFNWIADQASQRENVWDVGTGSGQAAQKLAETFSSVYATDIDKRQIENAPSHSRIEYAVSPAHNSDLPANSMDAITAGTALHWFDHQPFWEEVGRVAKPGAIFCAWTYHRARMDEDVEEWLYSPLAEVVEPYWSEGNRLSWRGYSVEELGMPFEPISVPEFKCVLHWTPKQISAFMRSWSAYQRACDAGLENVLLGIEAKALSQLGDKLRVFEMPLHTIAARIS